MAKCSRLALVSVAAASALFMAACSGGSSSSTATSRAASATSATGFQAAHKGGTLTLVASGAAGTLDPQVNYDNKYWQLYQTTYDGLLAFKKTGGSASYDIVPDLATAMPTISADGKTYTFTLRSGIKFSNGQTLTTDDVVASFQRIFKVSGPTAGTWYNNIVGGDACLAKPTSCTLGGGVSADKTTGKITLHLKSANPEFIYQLAVPHASILPKDSPSKDAGITPLPTTGPYKFVSYDPSKLLKLERNTYFKEWSHDAQPQGYPDQIDYKFGLTPEAQVTAIENGSADWMFDPPPTDRLNELGTKFASQVHVNAMSAMYYVTMNTNIPPFNNEKARQAINWAIDRSAMVRLYGGTNVARPVCTILPPGFPGHVDSCQYSKGGGTTWSAPDLAKAKQLIAESGTEGQKVTVFTSNDTVNASLGAYLQSLLSQLGYQASLKQLSTNIQFTYIQNTKNKVQMALTQWYADYPAASDFLHVLLSCSSFHPGSDSSVNIPGFCDKQIDAQMAEASAKQVTDAGAANAMWAKIDQQLMTASPIAPVFTPNLVDFISKEAGNYQYSKQFFMLIDQLWVK